MHRFYSGKVDQYLLIGLFKFISDYEGDIPGAAARDCGNYLDMNLGMAKYVAKNFLNNVLVNINESNLNYPE